MKYRGWQKVPGWLHPLDLELFTEILGHQQTAGVRGDVLEIGAFHGKSAIALGYWLNEGEQVTVCDIFGDTTQVPTEGCDPYDGLTADLFLAQWAKYHTAPPDLRVMPSSQLVLDRGYRFIHIDGGHAYPVVYEDINLCVPHATDVIVLDDYRSSHTPGVSAALWEAVADGKLFPFLLSEVKAYCAVTPERCDEWISIVAAWPHPHEQHELHGHHTVRVWA